MSRRKLLMTAGTLGVASVTGITGLAGAQSQAGEERWRFHTNDVIESSPTIVGETAYIGSLDGNLYAVETATGEGRWTFSTDEWIESSPAVAQGVVYVGSYDANIYAVDATTGERSGRYGQGGSSAPRRRLPVTQSSSGRSA